MVAALAIPTNDSPENTNEANRVPPFWESHGGCRAPDRGFHAAALPEACEAWGISDLGPAFRRTPRSRVPILLVSGDLDTKSPIGQAQRLLPYLENATHIVMRNAGHRDVLAPHPQVLEALERFIGGAAVESAVIELPALRFQLPHE